jgi:hypothetical protein
MACDHGELAQITTTLLNGPASSGSAITTGTRLRAEFDVPSGIDNASDVSASAAGHRSVTACSAVEVAPRVVTKPKTTVLAVLGLRQCQDTYY